MISRLHPIYWIPETRILFEKFWACIHSRVESIVQGMYPFERSCNVQLSHD